MESTDNTVCTSRRRFQLLSVAETARRLNLSRRSVENLIAQKELTPVRLNRRVHIKESQLEALIRKRMR